MKRSIRNNKNFISLIFSLALIIVGCNKEALVSPGLTQSEKESNLKKAGGSSQISGEASGAIQISGVGFYAEASECNSASRGATYAVRMIGDIEGCLYVFVDEYDCSPSGTYREKGREYFVGT